MNNNNNNNARNKSITKLNLPLRIKSQAHNVVILHTYSIVRKLLNDEDDADTPYSCHFTMFPALYTLQTSLTQPASRYVVK